MTNDTANNRYKVIDELQRLIKLDREETKRLMDLDDDVLDLFEALTTEQRDYLAKNFHQIFSVNEEAMQQLLRTFKQPH